VLLLRLKMARHIFISGAPWVAPGLSWSYGYPSRPSDAWVSKRCYRAAKQARTTLAYAARPCATWWTRSEAGHWPILPFCWILAIAAPLATRGRWSAPGGWKLCGKRRRCASVWRGHWESLEVTVLIWRRRRWKVRFSTQPLRLMFRKRKTYQFVYFKYCFLIIRRFELNFNIEQKVCYICLGFFMYFVLPYFEWCQLT